MFKLIGKLPIQKTLVSRNSIKTVSTRLRIRRYLSPRVMVKATQQGYATGERSGHVESMVLILQTGRKRYR